MTTTTVQISEGIELKIHPNGTQEWYKEGKIHRDNDQPAVIYADGTKSWCKEGKSHREMINLRSFIADGTKEWYKDGNVIVKMINPRLLMQMERNIGIRTGYNILHKSRLEDKKSQDETFVEENKRLKEGVARLKKMIDELVST